MLSATRETQSKTQSYQDGFNEIDNAKCWRGRGEAGALVAGGNAKQCRTVESSLAVLPMVKPRVAIGPSKCVPQGSENIHQSESTMCIEFLMIAKI